MSAHHESRATCSGLSSARSGDFHSLLGASGAGVSRRGGRGYGLGGRGLSECSRVRLRGVGGGRCHPARCLRLAMYGERAVPVPRRRPSPALPRRSRSRRAAGMPASPARTQVRPSSRRPGPGQARQPAPPSWLPALQRVQPGTSKARAGSPGPGARIRPARPRPGRPPSQRRPDQRQPWRKRARARTPCASARPAAWRQEQPTPPGPARGPAGSSGLRDSLIHRSHGGIGDQLGSRELWGRLRRARPTRAATVREGWSSRPCQRAVQPPWWGTTS